MVTVSSVVTAELVVTAADVDDIVSEVCDVLVIAEVCDPDDVTAVDAGETKGVDADVTALPVD